jgi:dolichyl-phosphate-mannose--protein O-mannosyl transferase
MNADALARRASGLATAVWEAVSARVPRTSFPATGYLLVLMILGGVVLRIQNVGYPLHYGFDEHQCAGAAHQFMVGVLDTAECCHPPLGKLLIGVGMLLFGNNPLGWRFVPLCFGLQCMVIAFLLVRSLFQSEKAGWFAAAFMAADGFFLSYSRASLYDVMLACLILWALFAAVSARGWGGVLVSALLVGVASGIKWVALLAVLPCCLAILVRKRAPWYSLVCFGAVPFVHLAIWMFGLSLIGQPNDPLSVWNEMRRRRDIHLGFPHETNPLESAWYTWLVLYHPIVIKSSQLGAEVRLASSVGNPLLWAAAHGSLLALPVLGFLAATQTRWRKRWRQWFDGGTTRALALLGAGWVCMMLLWFSQRIVTYWYHYLTPWGFALTLLAGLVAYLERGFPKQVFLFVLLVLAVAVFYAPVWAEIPISVAEARRRLPFRLWW